MTLTRVILARGSSSLQQVLAVTDVDLVQGGKEQGTGGRRERWQVGRTPTLNLAPGDTRAAASAIRACRLDT